MGGFGMDRPPLPSPDIQAQMGATEQPPTEPAGLGSIAQQQAGAAPAANPHGLLMAGVDAIKKVLDKLAGSEPGFAPFALRAIQQLDSGVSAVSSAPVAGSDQPPGGSPTGGPELGSPAPGAGGQMPPLA